ncbi:MAG: (Fe-S)-binding protein [Desulfobacteraceae bacterium]|nr:(Fe-S)-binding protein [Desulfobacteraceae bacterium]MBC2752610.1 (Fe-S)-binding protein [Desulfobacteraceae bacterium]
MTSMQELSRMMKALEDQLVVCMKCGMCQAVCPLFAETGREADVARGKLALLDGLMQQMFEDPEGVSQRLNKCLLCGSCAANCPSGVNVLEIFIKARAILTGYQGLPPAKKAIFKGLLAHPGLFDKLGEWGAKFQKIFTKTANEVIGTSCARFMSPLIGDRHFRPLAETPFHKMMPSLDTQAGASGRKVAFYVGCLADKIFPHLAQATVDVLTHHGVGIFMPENQACCGIPAVSAGDTETFQRLVRHNIRQFRAGEYDCLVTACATCTSTIKEIWPMMTATDDRLHAEARQLADKTFDIHQFLVSELSITGGEAGEADTPVTYHDPCHLKKSLKVWTEPRTLINASRGYRLKEMAESDWCCGMGGSFNLQYYPISGRIGERKREHIRSTGCRIVATGCPACMLQLSDSLSKAGDAIQVKHPVELYAESLKPT